MPDSPQILFEASPSASGSVTGTATTLYTATTAVVISKIQVLNTSGVMQSFSISFAKGGQPNASFLWQYQWVPLSPYQSASVGQGFTASGGDQIRVVVPASGAVNFTGFGDVLT